MLRKCSAIEPHPQTLLLFINAFCLGLEVQLKWQCLPSKCKALSSKPSTAKRKKMHRFDASFL
jgi:hypothetical protein